MRRRPLPDERGGTGGPGAPPDGGALYGALRAAGGLALGWFYRDVAVVGAERVPAGAPLLLAANHPNQLIDALLVGRAMPRPVTFTGKAILMDGALTAAVLRRLPFVPLRRAADERAKAVAKAAGAAADRKGPGWGGPPTGNLAPAGTTDGGEIVPVASPDRNAAAFSAILDALALGRAVLVFPEGISHNRPELAPLKTGVARIALQARDERGLGDLRIVPVGLTFERKWAARTRVLVTVGEPLRIGDWHGPADGAVEALTTEVNRRLRDVTLNFPDETSATLVTAAARVLAAVREGTRSLAQPEPPLAESAALARQLERVRRRIEDDTAHDDALAERARRLGERLTSFAADVSGLGAGPGDVTMATAVAPGARFVARELALVVVGGPLALWGRANHFPALSLARLLGRRTSRAPEDPAMHTLVAGLLLVPLFSAAQAGLVWWLAGGWWALLYALSLPAAGTWALRYGDRLRDARERARLYLRLRRDPGERERLLREARWLRDEAAAVERALATEAAGERTPGAA